MRLLVPSKVPALLLAAVALSVVACGGVKEGKQEADRAVAEFHGQFNQGRFDALWDAAGPELKGAVSQRDFSALLAAVRRKLGDVTGSTTRSWNVGSGTAGTHVALVQDTTFSTGKATEAFRFAVKDGKATLVGYDIASRDLILR